MSQPILELKDLHVVFERRRGVFSRQVDELHAVNRVNLEIATGESVGLVGESGSGKSTIAQAIERLVSIKDGRILLNGHDLGAAKGKALRDLRGTVQMIFQDPYSSLDPSMNIAQALEEPLRAQNMLQGDVRAKLVHAITSVGLREADLVRYPHEFSGGQRQRIAIARALIVEPSLLILDEALSALDVSTRAQILQLLQDLRERLGVAFLFIGHDLAVVRRVSDRIAVMYLGELVEQGPAQRVVSEPAHPYTAALIASIPNPASTDTSARDALVTRGTPPDPWNRPKGCAFASRCPFAMEVCREEAPEHFEVPQGGSAACHLHTKGPKLGGKTVLTLIPKPTGDGEVVTPLTVTHK